MSIKALSDYTFYSRYSRYQRDKKRRETYHESVKRVFDMHRTKYAEQIAQYPELGEAIDFAENMQNKRRVLAAQRSLQFSGAPIFKHELKMYNCLFTHIDRAPVFGEIMYALLCGCGVGFSVQKQHIAKLPIMTKPGAATEVYVVEDSIEGWADAVACLMDSYFRLDPKFKSYHGKRISFDFSKIRPEGSLIAGQFKAPGHKGLKTALEKMVLKIDDRVNFDLALRPIDFYDIIMFISDAVLSGGVRRSATICLFSFDDHEMTTAKTGDWYTSNPQRGRSNNSAALLRGHVTEEEFATLMASTKSFGEPGFVWLDDLDIGVNPCCEIAMYPKTAAGESGFQGCNLTEINGKWCSTEEKFLQACKAAAIIGTLQAGYTNFKYLSKATEEIFKREALLGCSITGMMDNPEVLFNPEVQRKGAEMVKEVNAEIAKLIGINPAARSTCVKPAGSTSCMLGTASGIHPQHAKRYIRRVQANKNEFYLKETQKRNPLAVEESVWSTNKTDMVISFLCEVPPGAIVKNQLGAIELLDKVKTTQQNWVEYGTNEHLCVIPSMRHNVSNTITVRPDEWDDVEKYIFDNQKFFTGISLLPASGDLDYPQAPFTTVLNATELVKEYGDASVFASGLIVDGLDAFDNNLWQGCDVVLSRSSLPEKPKHVKVPYCIAEDVKPLRRLQFWKPVEDYTWFDMLNFARPVIEIHHYTKVDTTVGDLKYSDKLDWVRRVKQFAERYFNNDLEKAVHCLKHVSIWKTWCDLSREYVEIDWETVIEEEETIVSADTLAAQACSGGQCELF